jgi:pyruvate,water dikinase
MLDWLRRRRRAGSAELPAARLGRHYRCLREVLAANSDAVELITALESDLLLLPPTDPQIPARVERLLARTEELVAALDELAEGRYAGLGAALGVIRQEIDKALAGSHRGGPAPLSYPLADLDRTTGAVVGGKAANLAGLRNAGLPVPDGFALGTAAYQLLCRENGLNEEIRAALAGLDPDDGAALEAASRRLREGVLAARVPTAVAEAIRANVRRIFRRASDTFAVRSSAVGEDSAMTFAGLFDSRVNVPEEELSRAYLEVCASRFNARAIYYRLSAGVAEVDSPMAVLFLRAVEPRTSGVVYTRDPADPKADELLVTAAWGGCFTGAAAGDSFRVARSKPHVVTGRRLTAKATRVVLPPGGGLAEEAVPPDLVHQGCLRDAELEGLATLALRAEEWFESPQDIEFVVDGAGSLWLLQSRPLQVGTEPTRPRSRPAKVEPLLQGGITIFPGQVSGPACVAEDARDLASVPDGAIVVLRHTSPECVKFLARAGGLVVDFGNPTGHVAALVREFRVPCLFEVADATRSVRDGDPLSLDAAGRRVYPGTVFASGEPASRRERRARQPNPLAERITSLHLLDPKAWAFRPTHCRSIHDVVRFAHEKAIESVFHVGDSEVEQQGGAICMLESEVPIDFFVLDLGGGIAPEAEGRTRLRPDQIRSIPFRALWRGMSHPDVSWAGREYVSFSGFASVVARAVTDRATESRELGARSYVAIGADYVNLNSRLAYHYAMVDACVADHQGANFVNFRFKGGGADPFRKNLRARFLEECLRHHDFAVDVRHDLVTAWLRRLPRPAMEERLDVLGRLMACSRQLDMFMANESTMRWFVAQFLKGNYRFRVEDGAEPELGGAGVGDDAHARRDG